MKVPRPLILLASGSALVLIIFGCKNLGTGPNANRPVTIAEDHIVLNGAKISDTDAETLNAVLRKYDKSLYRIRIYKDGKLDRTFGRLSEDIIGRATVRTVATLNPALVSGWTVQIGTNMTPQGVVAARTNRPTPPIPPPLRPLNRQMLETQSRELVRQLRPIIEKYGSGSFGQER